MKIILIILLIVAGQEVLLAQATPSRYETFLNQTITALSAKKTALEKKLSTFQEKRTRKLTVHATQEAQIERANQLAKETLEKAISNVTTRVAILQKEKELLARRGIKDRAQEDALIKKMQLQQTVADLQEQLNQAKTSKLFIDAQKSTNPQSQAVVGLEQQWKRQQSQIETKLQRALADLAAIRVEL